MEATAQSTESPLSLWQQCLDYCVQHPHTLCHKTRPHGPCVLHDWVSLPLEVCQSLLDACYEHDLVLDDRMLHIFTDTSRTQLKCLQLQDSLVTDSELELLLQHRVNKLDISNCVNLTPAVVEIINRCCRHLKVLTLGGATSVLDRVDDWSKFHELPENYGPWSTNPLEPLKYIFMCPHLVALTVHNLKGEQIDLVIPGLLAPLRSLTYLDLSGCLLDLDNLKHLDIHTNLRSLILHDVAVLYTHQRLAFQHIVQAKELRLLDVSMGKESPVMFPDPEDGLAYLVQHLPHLVQLDISGTNLAGFQAPEGLGLTKKENECSVAGLEGREMEFLGLLGCAYQACERKNIPAKMVAGSGTETQILLAVQRYVDRSDMLIKALNHLFHIFRFSECMNQKMALEGILCAMKKHSTDNHIQISGSASLFYIMKGDQKHRLDTQLKRRLIRAILNGMDKHMGESTMLRNGCLTLCQFRIPQDVLFAYDRMVCILLRMVAPPVSEEFVQRIGIYLLNSLACQVDGREKQLIGDRGAIDTMLKVIQHKLDTNQNDEVMEIAWSTMWNVTDETPSNCKRFLDGDGMGYFRKCLQQFPDHEELLRNMMGLMGNVAEVGPLRSHLMQSEYVRTFTELLDSGSDGIEVSYNACGVLAHMTSDGPMRWTVTQPSRFFVLGRMMAAIQRWDLKTKRNINYRSFEPILRLVPNHTPEVQHWSVWALCNLTKMYRKKYCPLVETEGGLPLLSSVCQQQGAYPETKDLAQQVLDRCQRYHTDAEYDSASEGEDEDGMADDNLDG